MGSVMVKDGSGAFVLRALLCPKDFYGVSTPKKFGLKASPCLACPPNMVTPTTGATANLFRATSFMDGTTDTSTAAIPDGMAFYDMRACVATGGFGYDGGIAQKCAQGFWAAGGDIKACTK